MASKPGRSLFFHRLPTVSGMSRLHDPLSPRREPLVRPWGTAFSMARRTFRSESGSSSATSEVCTAIMPQPMSTPTAAGMIAPTVGMTEPTVAP